MSKKTVRLPLESLDDRQLKQLLDRVRAERDARRQHGVPKAVRNAWRPTDQNLVTEACERLQKKLFRHKKATLEDWYTEVEKSTQLSRVTVRKWTRDWLIDHCPWDVLPEHIGSYYIYSRQEFNEVKWVLVWAALSQQFPDIKRWLRDYTSRAGCLPSELPDEVLPAPLQDKTLNRLAPSKKLCYMGLIRMALQQARMEYGSRSLLALRNSLGISAEK